ncbi:uncharacterized protein [Centroberyx affinis]|uniref:uncharacterized protein n=1 Tax=Centroberyx affinis TaxID=166261 RepID=UPI003A5BFA01
MAENYFKSKLKRKKSVVEEHQVEISSRKTLQQSRITLSSGDITAAAEGSLVPTVAWWNREELPALESLWVLTLRSALPHLDTQQWDPVPDLPNPSTVRPTTHKLGEQQWCNLSEDVAPFPEPLALRPPPSPDPLPLNSSHQELPAQTGPTPNAQSPPVRALAESRPPILPENRPAAAAAAAAAPPGPGSAGRGGEKRRREEERNGSRPIKGQPLFLQKRGGNEQRAEAEDKEEEEEVCRSDGGGGGLRSCPMCLLVFPAGFTQMDCDGHLAQCLSEMNVDMSW